MSQAVKLDVFYPYPPERVWQVLTDRRALAAWMMENDFEPKLGHKFQFYSQPLLGVTTTIHCEVVELEEPTRLVYTWQESPTAEPSLVIWSLTPVTGGTQLSLKHHQYSYTTTVATSTHPGARSKADSSRSAQPDRRFGLFQSERLPVISGLDAFSDSTWRDHNRLSTIALENPASQTFEWSYVLNQTLPNVLSMNR